MWVWHVSSVKLFFFSTGTFVRIQSRVDAKADDVYNLFRNSERVYVSVWLAGRCVVFDAPETVYPGFRS